MPNWVQKSCKSMEAIQRQWVRLTLYLQKMTKEWRAFRKLQELTIWIRGRNCTPSLGAVQDPCAADSIFDPFGVIVDEDTSSFVDQMCDCFKEGASKGWVTWTSVWWTARVCRWGSSCSRRDVGWWNCCWSCSCSLFVVVGIGSWTTGSLHLHGNLQLPLRGDVILKWINQF